MARGERVSAQLLTAAVARLKRRVPLRRCRGRHGDRRRAWQRDAEARRDDGARTRKVIAPALKAGAIVIVPGFIGRSPDGSVATLGRGGSDLTATVLARALGAKRVVLWKDVPGILTADPRLVPDARLIPQLHHREAAEVAHYGAKVLHPRALDPGRGDTHRAARAIVPGSGTAGHRSVRAAVAEGVSGQGARHVAWSGGRDGRRQGHGRRARHRRANVHRGRRRRASRSRRSSRPRPKARSASRSPNRKAERAVRRLRQTFRHEIEQGLIDGVSARPNMAVIAVVGDGMVGTPGISARVFAALESGGVNVVAIAQGSSERNISFVVAGDDVGEAARRVHARFSAVEDWRRPSAGPSAHRRGAAGIRARRPRAVGSDRDQPEPRRPHRRVCSIDPATCSMRAASAGAACFDWRRRKTAAACCRRSAASRPRHRTHCR